MTVSKIIYSDRTIDQKAQMVARLYGGGPGMAKVMAKRARSVLANVRKDGEASDQLIKIAWNDISQRQ